ncbi:hypothetical protein [Ferruginibacter sp.]|nr:hypothetical protein [Ferruginibacter sp.]
MEKFYGYQPKNEVILQWETSSEINTLHFTIQYSTNGINFENIGTVAAAGSSTSGKTYRYIHQKPLPVTGYYRISQTDINGKNSFSVIVKNYFGAVTENDFILNTNNITNGVVKVQLNKTTVVNVISIDGRMLYSKNMNKGLNYINVSNIAKGYYILQSVNQSQKILIQ